MAWSAPMTAVANATFTAAQFNQYVRENLNETAPAKATTSGGYFVADGVNSIAERFATGNTDLNSGTTTSTTFTDLTGAAIGPTVTVTTGTMALVFIHGQMGNSAPAPPAWPTTCPAPPPSPPQTTAGTPCSAWQA